MEDFDRKYFVSKSQKSKNDVCIEYIKSLEALKRCDGCKYYKMASPYCWQCARGTKDYYEPKDIK